VAPSCAATMSSPSGAVGAQNGVLYRTWAVAPRPWRLGAARARLSGNPGATQAQPRHNPGTTQAQPRHNPGTTQAQPRRNPGQRRRNPGATRAHPARAGRKRGRARRRGRPKRAGPRAAQPRGCPAGPRGMRGRSREGPAPLERAAQGLAWCADALRTRPLPGAGRPHVPAFATGGRRGGRRLARLAQAPARCKGRQGPGLPPAGAAGAPGARGRVPRTPGSHRTGARTAGTGVFWGQRAPLQRSCSGGATVLSLN
jgi:hypothetical protein